VLIGAVALAVLGPLACSSAPPHDLPGLLAQLKAARSDNQLATAAAATAPPPLTAALSTAAAERSAHAHALEDEIARLTGHAAPTPAAPAPSAATSAAASSTTAPPPPPPPTAQDVITALRNSADSAAQQAAAMSGYRAGLLGSVSAACAALYTVALASAADTDGKPASESRPPAPATGAIPPPTTAPSRPTAASDAALYDAVATEHGVIYGYGIVSGYTEPEANDLVSASLTQHRAQRETGIALLGAHGVAAPVPAAGYQLPILVNNPTDASNLAIRMEQDAEATWRAVLERATDRQVRAAAVSALTGSAITAAHWRQLLGVSPITKPFPGGSELS
jgi:hypothetical protein